MFSRLLTDLLTQRLPPLHAVIGLELENGSNVSERTDSTGKGASVRSARAQSLLGLSDRRRLASADRWARSLRITVATRRGHRWERARMSVILPGTSHARPLPDLLAPSSTDLCLYGAVWTVYFRITMLPTLKACDAFLGCWGAR